MMKCLCLLLTLLAGAAHAKQEDCGKALAKTSKSICDQSLLERKLVNAINAPTTDAAFNPKKLVDFSELIDVRPGETVQLMGAVQVVHFTNDFLFPLSGYQATVTDRFSRKHYVFFVEPSSCEVFQAVLLNQRRL